MVEVAVAVIGAGASGLVAARHLLRCGFRPLVLERRPHLGGAWAQNNNSSGRTSDNGPLWDSLRPNLSRYTQCFSDFPWSQSVPRTTDDPGTSSSSASAYAARNEVHQYLEQYATAHGIQPHYNCEVTSVAPLKTEETASATTAFSTKSSSAGYQVEWIEGSTGTVKSQTFDKVVVASGFFSQGVLPDNIVNPNDDLPESLLQQQRIIHSQLYKSPIDYTNQTVAVIGAAFSALEIASDLCPYAQNVVHIVPSIPWVLPRHVVVNGGSLPLDMALYRRTSPAPKPRIRVLDSEGIQARHTFLQSLSVGGSTKHRQAFGSLPSHHKPPVAVISDHYLDWVVSDRIQVVRGRCTSIAQTSTDGTGTSHHPLRLHIDPDPDDDHGGGPTTVEVDRVVCCTGYQSNLDYLEVSLRESLEYDAKDGFAPLTLAWDVLHPQHLGLGFVGMYRGVYFGVMEMQARLLSELWCNNVSLKDSVLQNALDASRQVRHHQPRAQFPQFDYVGSLDEVAHLLNLVPPTPYGDAGQFVTPSYFQPSVEYSKERQTELDDEVKRGRTGLDELPNLVLSALVGHWTYDRIIRHRSTGRTETVSGNVRYTRTADDVVRYREDGVLQLPNGKQMEVFREYEYTVGNNALELYFVEGGERTYLFLSLRFQPQTTVGETNDGTTGDNDDWVATSDHLCVKDLYKGTFRIALQGATASQVTMTYQVQGPNKDYEAVTILTPATR